MHCGINKLLERGAFGQTIHGMVESLSYWTGKILNPVIQSITCHNNSLLDQWLSRVRQLVYVAYVHMPTFVGVRMILGIRTLTLTLIFFLWFYKVLKTFLVLITLHCLKAYCCIFALWLFVCSWKRQILYCFVYCLFFPFTLNNFIFQFFIKAI